jgi:hypothetical protein
LQKYNIFQRGRERETEKISYSVTQNTTRKLCVGQKEWWGSFKESGVVSTRRVLEGLPV